MSRVVRPLRPLSLCVAVAAAACAVAAPAASAAGCDRVASPTGSDSAAGSLAAPYRSVQKLADSLASGQSGCIRGGTYRESVEIRSGGVTLTGTPGEKATIIGEFEIHKSAPNVTVERLYLNGSTAGRTSPIVNAANATFRANDVTNDHHGICFALGDSHPDGWGRADGAVLDSNRIHDCGRLPSTNYDHGIYIEAANGARITNNWIYDNSDFGVHLFPDAQNVTVRGNVIDGNGMGVTFSGDGGQASSNNDVEGNVISNSKTRWNVESWWGAGQGHGNSARGNCLHGSSSKSYYNENGGLSTEAGGFSASANKVADPGYANRGASDYRLPGGSACRAAFAGDPTAVPGPDGLGPMAAATSASARAVRVKLKARKRSVRAGRRAPLRGKVANAGGRRRILIYAKIGKRNRVVARVRSRANGSFTAKPRVRGHARVVRFRAVVKNLARSRAVRVRVKH